MRAILGSGSTGTTIALPRQDATARPDEPDRAGRGWLLLVWAVAFTLLVFYQFGRMTFDTKLGVNIDPAGFYGRLWHLWNPLQRFGAIEDQYIGYAFPMGAFSLLAHLLQVPVWLAERLWMASLVAVGFWGLVRLAEALRIGTEPSRLIAGAVFALWPTFTIVIGSTSAAVLPGMLVPWAILPLIRARSPRNAAARSGVVVLCMGGVNAVSTLAVLVLPGLYLLTRRSADARATVRLLAWWVLAVTLACLWWLVPLLYQGRYGYDFLPYIEQARTTTQTTSAAAVLRGSGNWTAYLRLGQSWLPAGWMMVGSTWPVAAGAAVAACGLSGLARRDMPEERWLRLTAALAALITLAGYWGPLGGPFNPAVHDLLNGVLAPIRNLFKFEPLLAVVLALGIAHALACLPRPRGLWWRPAAFIGLAAVLAGLGLPYLTGQVLQAGSFPRVPSYWQQAADFLHEHSPTQTAFVVPADSHGLYAWGDPIDDPLEPLARSPWVQRDLVPFSGGGVRDLLNAAEEAVESGAPVPGLAAYLARAGVRYVVVRNDLDSTQFDYTSPDIVHRTLQRSGFVRAAAFGPPVVNARLQLGTATQLEVAYPAVEIFQAARPSGARTVQVAPVSDTTVVAGGPGSLLQLADQGLLGDRPIVTAGDRLPAGARPAVSDITDGLRRTDTLFGLISNNTSYTYTPTEKNPVDDEHLGAGQPPRQLLPANAAGHQTVAVVTGAASVTASSSGSWWQEAPQDDPVNAFDGDPATAWVEGRFGSSVGQWLQIAFDHPVALSGPVSLRLLDDGAARPVATRLTVSTEAGRVTTATRPTAAPQRLNVPAGRTRWLRLTISGATGGLRGGPGAGISEVAIPGVRVTRYLRPPPSPAGAAATVFSFHRDPGSPLGIPPAPEPALNRTFDTAWATSPTVAATAVPVAGSPLNALLDRLGRKPTLGVSASSTFGSLPGLRPENLFDGNDATAWIAATPTATLHLSWQGRRRVDEIRLGYAGGVSAAPARVTVTGSGVGRTLPVPANGDLTFPPLLTDRLDIAFTQVRPLTSYSPLRGSAGQLPIGLAEMRIPALAGLTAGAPKAAARFTLSCGQGPPVTLDGRTYPTSVTGTVADLTTFQRLPVRLCTTGSTLRLPAGRHWLVSPGAGPLAITDLSVANGSAPAEGRARTVRVGSWGAENRTLQVGPGPESYLEVHQAANPGWTATLNGHRLAAVTLDGWQQGFVLPAGGGGTARLTFTPATGYHRALVIAAVAVLALLALATIRRLPGRPRRPRRWHARSPVTTGPSRNSAIQAAVSRDTVSQTVVAQGTPPRDPVPPNGTQQAPAPQNGAVQGPAPQSPAAQGPASQSAGPQGPATQSPALENSASQSPAPQYGAPQSTAAQGPAPQSAGPQGPTAQNRAPQYPAPQYGAPQSTAAQGPAFENSTPQSPAPQNAAPQNGTVQGPAPESPAPQGPAAQSAGSQNGAPQSPAPQSAGSQDGAARGLASAGPGGIPIVSWAGVAAITALLVIVGGPVAVAVPAVALVALTRPRWTPVLAFGAMTVAGLFAVIGLHDGPLSRAGAFGGPAQAAALIALTAAIMPALSRSRR